MPQFDKASVRVIPGVKPQCQRGFSTCWHWVSVNKSSVFFSPNTSAVSNTEICQILNIDTEALLSKNFTEVAGYDDIVLVKDIMFNS